MEPNVKNGYPDKLSSKEIKEEMEKNRRFANGGGNRTDYIVAANSIIQSGQAELSDRFSRRVFWMTFFLTIMGVVSGTHL